MPRRSEGRETEKGKIKEIHIHHEYCKGCGYCIDLCPRNVLKKSKEMTKKGFYPPFVKQLERCTGCHICEDVCPDFAIYIEEMRHNSGKGEDHGK
jgi:2-oxoglutarate ferredoxin oxidoreductase subunit delta